MGQDLGITTGTTWNSSTNVDLVWVIVLKMTPKSAAVEENVTQPDLSTCENP